MKRTNSVGGHRTYPTTPQMHEIEARAHGEIGVFNDGLDRLNRERQLTVEQEQFLHQLADNAPLKQRFARIAARTNRLWNLAMDHQRFLRGESDDDGPYTTANLGQRMIAESDTWTRFKQDIAQEISAASD